MTINPIGTSIPNPTVEPASFQTRLQQALAPVAQLFGESSDQLMSELDSGHTSLSKLAAQKGVTQTDLGSAIKQGLQQSAASNGQSLSDSQLTNIANRIANHRHGGHHHHGGASTSTTSSSTSSSISSSSSTEALLQLLESQNQSQNQNPTNPSF
jgi:hypothetical protein